MLKRAWNSPTLMTWLSYSTKALTLFGVLPLILKRFTPGDVVLWYLFSTIITLQALADFGFRQTFSRLISYAFSGAGNIDVLIGRAGEEVETSKQPNKPLLNEIISIMKFIYLRLSVVAFVLMGIFGTWSMVKPIAETSNHLQAWYSWVIILFVSCISFYGKLYMNFLEGLNKIALVRRIETLTSTGSILSSIVVLFFAPSLLNLVIVNQFWVIIVTIRDWYLCLKTDDKLYVEVSKKLPFNSVIFKKVWEPAWRSGISGLMSVGLTNVTGIVYAQIGNTAAVASYLLALRIINQIKDISMAPFYSKLPLLAMLRVKKDMGSLVSAIKRGMFLSHLVFVLGFLAVGLSSHILLGLIHSHVEFVDQPLWMLLGFAFFVQRYGAMHIQVYISTNHIISHIADGVSGILYIVTGLLLSRPLGVYAIPVSMLIGYMGFYAWYSAMHSYKSINISFWKLESRVLAIPVLVFFIYLGLIYSSILK